MASSKEIPQVIELNVGGKYFTVSLKTLTKYPDSTLAAMFTDKQTTEKDKDGRYFICADGQSFSHILNFLRYGTHPKPEETPDLYPLAKSLGLKELTKEFERSSGMMEKSLSDRIKTKIGDYQTLYDKTLDKIFTNQANADIYQSPYLSTEVVISVSTAGSGDEESTDDGEKYPLPGADHICTGYDDVSADVMHDSKFNGTEENLLNFLIHNLWKDGYNFNYNTGSSMTRCKAGCRRKLLVLTFTSRDLFTASQD